KIFFCEVSHSALYKVGQASSPDIMMTSGDACPTFWANFNAVQFLAKDFLPIREVITQRHKEL
ncbi:MAG: hypothetical protein AAB318_01555, partial [Planctomycetota bacterium]